MTRNSRARIDSLIRTELLLIVTLLGYYESASRALLIGYCTKKPRVIQEVCKINGIAMLRQCAQRSRCHYHRGRR